MQRPSRLIREEPSDALYNYFNVHKIQLAEATIPVVFDMPIIRNAHLPTHALAAVQSDSLNAATPPSIFPIDAAFYAQGFRVGLNILSPTYPTPHATSGNSRVEVVTLPVVPITVPHVASLPLLLLFGLGLEIQPNLMAERLLPPQVIEEFPNAAAMAQNLSRLSEDHFQRCLKFNQGIWKNILALGLQDTRIVELVQTVWNVTAEAKRIRLRGQHRS